MIGRATFLSLVARMRKEGVCRAVCRWQNCRDRFARRMDPPGQTDYPCPLQPIPTDPGMPSRMFLPRLLADLADRSARHKGKVLLVFLLLAAGLLCLCAPRPGIPPDPDPLVPRSLARPRLD